MNRRHILQIFSLFLLLTIFVFLFVVTHCAQSSNLITDYQQTFIPTYDTRQKLHIIIRTFYKNTTHYFLVVNPNDFTTKVIAADRFKSRRITTDGSPGYFTMTELQNTPYVKALIRYTSPPYELENYGISHSERSSKGIFLTIDMCPSVKEFETDFFKSLIQLSDELHQPIPIALSMTGLWIHTHPKEFKWFIQQQHDNKLAITWINHSFSHVYYADLEQQDNFLLNAQTNLPHEILATEKLLLEHGQIPSVFFRAPGLVLNKELVLTLRKFGLIPVGSNAWLAREQQPQNGSIILVHGNSNEHAGIELIMPILKKHEFKLLPLSQLFKN